MCRSMAVGGTKVQSGATRDPQGAHVTYHVVVIVRTHVQYGCTGQ
jgi:hypothetical protein